MLTGSVKTIYWLQKLHFVFILVLADTHQAKIGCKDIEKIYLI